MTEPKFTPGPYTVCIEDYECGDTGEYDTMFCIDAEDDGKIITIAQVVPIHYDEDKTTATTHLLAAAPEMYDMLAFILEFVENGGNEGEIRECYAEAIAKILRKARGEM